MVVSQVRENVKFLPSDWLAVTQRFVLRKVHMFYYTFEAQVYYSVVLYAGTGCMFIVNTIM